MEGLNTILIYNSNLTSTITDKTASDPVANGVIIYQSTSGDAESTTGSEATFEASNSILTSSITNGAMFYLTNTKANIVLSNTTLDFDSDNVNLLRVQGNDSYNWGTAGSNESGNTVSIVVNGETVISGSSEYTVTVTGTYSDSITTDSTNQLSTNYIDRSKFDAYYNVSTTFASALAVNAESTNQETVNSSVTNNDNESQDTTNELIVKEDTSTSSAVPYALAVVCVIAGGGFIIYKNRKRDKF